MNDDAPAAPVQPASPPAADEDPPATQADARRQLGWWLLPNNAPPGADRD